MGLNELDGAAQRSAFERRLEDLLPELYRCACALAGNRTDAEDLVHDACVKALTSFKSAELVNDGACRAWVRQILVNTFRDRYRREHRAPVRTASTPDEQEGTNIIELALSPDPSPGDWAQYSQFESAAQAAMAALPPEVRVVTTLHLVNGVPYKEISQIANCPLGTVMSRLSRGRRLLRAALGRFVASAETEAAPQARNQL